jgi:anaerobic selenocysteine-containing dehydrogenase
MQRDRIAEPWGTRTPISAGSDWPVRVDTHLSTDQSEVERWVQSACVLCSNGCAVDIAVKGGRMVGVRGRAVDRVNHGRLGPKGLFGWQANHSRDRLTRPLVRRDGKLVESSWDEAMGLIVDKSRAILKEVGPLAFGFYTSGQLMLEEYYTLGVIGKAGLGTPHMDGNTRLCTATAAQALKESFGTDGQPGSYTDIEHCDTICLWGHDVAETQTVLWMRMLDRLEGPDAPKLIVVDPRRTVPAQRADVHLAIRNGTNVSLLNALIHELIAGGYVDQQYIASHTIGFDALKRTEHWTAAKAAEICRVPAAQIEQAAQLIGRSRALLSTVLQGFYQSNQATAAAVQVNNIHLIRGLIGRPGSGILQMNGQPTAQNTREAGADGDLPGFRNWDNIEHVEELARLWNVDPMVIPHWAPPTHAMGIWRYAEEGSIRLLWISATNPAVSMPELVRVRRILEKPGLFKVVQDIFLTETARYADVVLPAAMWGEKTGTFTNVDRTVHIADKAVDPPGEACSDLDIFLDYARRMDFRDRDGRPLIKWRDPESAFEAWKECSRGRPCDYTGITYQRLRGGSGIQWPCHDAAPDGTERLYVDAQFHTRPEDCEAYGHDLATGAAVDAAMYKAQEPDGRAIIKPAAYSPPPEEPDADYPLYLTTGRTLFHFHTRTKTARAPQLNAAAPDVWVEIGREDAARLGIAEGDTVRVRSRRGEVIGRARVSGVREGVVFIPFHYGYFDSGEHPRAANELTITEWDPVSKQPYFKFAAVKVEKVRTDGGTPAPAPTNTASAPLTKIDRVTAGGPDAMATEDLK